MPPPKIAIVSNSAYNIWHFRESLWKALLANGYQVIAIAPADGKERNLHEHGITFIPLPALDPVGVKPLRDIVLLRQLTHIFKTEKPEVVFNFTVKPNIYGSIAAKNAKIASIATITGLGTTWLNGVLMRKITIRLYRYSLPLANAVVGQNAYDLEVLQSIGVKARKWQLIPGSGVDVEAFSPAAFETSKVGFRFLFIGRMLIDKGVEELFNAWRQIAGLVPGATLQLLGQFDGSHPRCIPRRIWDAGLELPGVEYLGYEEDVRESISQSDVVVLPSYREGISRSLLEALAMATPVIATDVAGCKELSIPDKTGWRIPAKSSAALAEAMLEAYRLKPEDLKSMGHQGRQLVKEAYSEHIVASQYLQLVNAIRGR